MPPRHGYDALKPAAFGNLDPEELESLVRELVNHELTERHAEGFTLDGPPPKNVGGTDLRATIGLAPRVSRSAYQQSQRAQPITFDEPAPVVYSVKSGKTAKSKALEEAKKRSAWAVDALQQGGRFVLVLSGSKDAPPSKPKKQAAGSRQPKKSLQQELVAAYAARVQPGAGVASPVNDRIHIYDANDLRDYLRNVRPAISLTLLEKLGLPSIPELLDLDGWLALHQNDRPPMPTFVWDAERRKVAKRIIDGIQASNSGAYSGAVWLVSPPGVGKTRLVYEALAQHDSLSRRTYVATSAAAAVAALGHHSLLRSYRDSILVVDDCAEHEVGEVYRAFGTSNVDQTARMVLITPMAAREISALVPPTLPRLELEPMDAASRRELVATQIGALPSDTAVENVAALTEGFPWFAVLVSREMSQDATAPQLVTVSQAVDLALCGREENLPREAQRRGAALLTVMLCEGEPLSTMMHDGAELAELFTHLFSSWSDIHATIDICARRGLLRAGAGGVFRYVTPSVVEREIALRFLAPPPGPGAPPPLSSLIKSPRMRSRYDKLRARVEKLGFSEPTLQRLAEPTLQRIAAARMGIGALAATATTQEELLFASRHLPLQTADLLRRHIDATSIPELQADGAWRRTLMFALEAVSHRRHTFATVEAALFRLARAENETYANSATEVWAGLFDAELNTTYLSPRDKAPLLKRRVCGEAPEDRLVALEALGHILSVHGFKTVGDERDGPYPAATMEEIHANRLLAFQLLCARMADPDVSVAKRAGEIGAREFRSALATIGVRDVTTTLAEVASNLPERALRQMREAFELAEHYDRRGLEISDADPSWARLRDVLTPRSFEERLRQRVGAFGAASLRVDDQKDIALANEALKNIPTLLTQLDWLVSDEAVRSLQFAHALGQADQGGALVPALLSYGAKDFLSSYLRGQSDAGRSALVDGCIQRLRQASPDRDGAALAIWRSGYSAERLAWLIEDIRAGAVADRVLAMFTMGRWDAPLSAKEFDTFVQVLLERGTFEAAATAVDWLLRRLDDAGTDSAPLRAPLLEAMLVVSKQVPTGHFAYVWELAAKKLVELGDGASVATMLVSVLSKSPYGNGRQELQSVFRFLMERASEATWNAIYGQLGRGDGDRIPASLARSIRRAGGIPDTAAAAVLDWVGHDVDRGGLAAAMVSMHSARLPAVARGLLIRFGAPAAPARILAADLQTTHRAVSSLAEFMAAQVARVEGWKGDADPQVEQFIDSALADLRTARDHWAGREEYERRRIGA